MTPFAIGAAGLGASAGGSLLGAAGSLFQGSSQSSMYRYQAGISRMNANIAKQNAGYAIEAGEKDASRTGTKYAQVIGSQKAGQAAGNLDVNFGSAQQVRDSQHQVAIDDLSQIRENANRKAYGYEVEATKDIAEAKGYDAASRTSRVASYLNAAGSVLGGAASVSSKWLQGTQSGLWGGGEASRDTLGGNNDLDSYYYAWR